jgi:hypothetical protein
VTGLNRRRRWANLVTSTVSRHADRSLTVRSLSYTRINPAFVGSFLWSLHLCIIQLLFRKIFTCLNYTLIGPQWCRWGFFPQLPTEPGVDSASKMSTRKTPRGDGGQCVGLTTIPPSWCRKSRKSGALTYRNPLGQLGLSRDTTSITGYFMSSIITLRFHPESLDIQSVCKKRAGHVLYYYSLDQHQEKRHLSRDALFARARNFKENDSTTASCVRVKDGHFKHLV